MGSIPTPRSFVHIRIGLRYVALSLNLRVTAKEKLAMEVAATKLAGADGVSDFVRTAALAEAGC